MSPATVRATSSVSDEAMTLLARLARRSQKTSDGCWEWMGACYDNGYGYIRDVAADRRPRLTHRLAYETFVGRVPGDKVLHHTCGNKRCWRGDHLELVTPREHQHIHAAQVDHCPRGHPYDEENTIHGANGRVCRICSRARHRRRTLELAGNCEDCGVKLRSRTAKRCQRCHLRRLHARS